MLIALSTSGQSQNILAGIRAACAKDIVVVGMTSVHGSEMAALCDYLVCVPSTMTAHIQEAHITLGHIICGLVERALFEKG